MADAGKIMCIQLWFKEGMLGDKHDAFADAFSELRDEPCLAAAGGTSAFERER